MLRARSARRRSPSTVSTLVSSSMDASISPHRWRGSALTWQHVPTMCAFRRCPRIQPPSHSTSGVGSHTTRGDRPVPPPSRSTDRHSHRPVHRQPQHARRDCSRPPGHVPTDTPGVVLTSVRPSDKCLDSAKMTVAAAPNLGTVTSTDVEIWTLASSKLTVVDRRSFFLARAGIRRPSDDQAEHAGASQHQGGGHLQRFLRWGAVCAKRILDSGVTELERDCSSASNPGERRFPLRPRPGRLRQCPPTHPPPHCHSTC